MDRLRAAIDEVVEKVKMAINGEPKNPVEILLDEHLPFDEDVVAALTTKSVHRVAIPTFIMNDFASRTNNVVDYMFIMARIWEVLAERQHDAQLMRKALNLLHYLLINGSIQVLKDCQDYTRMNFLQELASDYNRYEYEQYQFSKHLDIGAGVRKAASDIVHLLNNERDLFLERRKAEKVNQKLADRGLRSSYPSPRDTESPVTVTLGSAISSDFENRPGRYSDSFPIHSPLGQELKIITHTEEDLVDDRRRRRYSDGGNRHRSSNASARTNPPQQPEAKAPEVVDLLGLETIPLEPSSTNQLRPPAPTTTMAGSRYNSSPSFPQKLVATI